MKKNLLALFALGALYSTNAQTVYVKDKATVAVKSNTLLYMGNGMELASSTPATIINEGNIQINLSDLLPGFTSSTVPANTPPTDTPHYFKNFNNDGTTHNDGSNFVNTYTDATHYGQLMFTLAKGNKDPNNSSDNNRILGKVTMEQPYANPANFNWLPIALPFNGPTGIVSQTVQDFYTATFNLPFLRYTDTSKSRYSSSMLLWDDKDFYYATMFADNPLLAVTNQRVFILNLWDNALANTFTANTGTAARIQYKGYPFGDASRPVKLNTIAGNSTNPFWEDRGAKYTPTEPWSVWSERKNPANERYKTFIGDSFVTYDPTSIKYGKWLINFGNPFTHNIDLAAAFAQNSAGFPENLLAIQKVGTQVKWVKGTGNTTPTQASLKASVTDNSTSATPLAKNPDIINKKWMGDANALIVKPFEIVTFKLDRQVKGSYGIGF
ncbi:hypothetical protein [Algoriella sp.]|uniref:hypothetical protein n=1 Tax=Algoriella sp. TaxID=1872434 RepID=UPI001B22450B|nr:hypothetical protein [Algoriella sp.]MBO6213772.1 hypothetical protein [Algoriella sp.]